MTDQDIHQKIDINTYQKEAKLKSGTKLLLRPMVAEDQDALYEFFKAIPKEDARYLRDDVSSRLLVEKWAKNLDYEKTLPILAIKDDAIIGDATINRRRSGWKHHLGTVRVFVHKEYRNVGLGRMILQELSHIAYRLGIEKLVAEIPEVNESALITFKKEGFNLEACIPNMVKDRENMPMDLVVMIKNIKPPHDESYDYDF